MPEDSSLPNIKIGSDAAKDPDFEGGETEVATVEYLDYEVVEENDWEIGSDLFEKAADADLDESEYGTMDVSKNRKLLDAAEDHGFEWPFSCRAASCANCAGILVDGDLEMEMNLILTDEEVETRGIRLTCQSKPASDHVQVIYNAKHLDYLQDRVIGEREV